MLELRNSKSIKLKPGQKRTFLSLTDRFLPAALRKHWELYLLALPAVLSILVFSYGPLFGLVIAFEDFSPFRGVLGSTWVGWANFVRAFHSSFFWIAFQNSVIISILKLIVGFPAGILLALLLNEVRIRWFKATIQTSTMLPYLVSWVVVGSMSRALLAPEGVVNELRNVMLGLQPFYFLSSPDAFRWVIVLQDTWKGAGYSALLYLAAIASIDPTIYEAAKVDGANRWHLARYITLPGISNTVITLLVLSIGYLISAGFEQIYIMYNVSVYSTADILETYTFRLGLGQSDYSLATAVGMFQSIISLTLVFIANWLAKHIRHEGLF
jgi:ABC-type polysaccharide transport system permease subunit